MSGKGPIIDGLVTSSGVGRGPLSGHVVKQCLPVRLRSRVAVPAAPIFARHLPSIDVPSILKQGARSARPPSVVAAIASRAGYAL